MEGGRYWQITAAGIYLATSCQKPKTEFEIAAVDSIYFDINAMMTKDGNTAKHYCLICMNMYIPDSTMLLLEHSREVVLHWNSGSR